MKDLRQSEKTSIPDRQRQLTDEFLLLQDWHERYEYLIELGGSLPPMPPRLRAERNRLSGCQSETYLAAEHEFGRLRLYAASDMPAVAGILAIATRIYSGETPTAILRHPPAFLDRIGLTHGLSPHRRIALLRINERLLALAADRNHVTQLAS